ncbi:MAG: hypothetical protein ACPGXL_02425 [Chitinophagales bacterium]
MPFFTALVPYWVSILFLMVIPIPIFLIAGLTKKGSTTLQQGKKNYFAVLLFYGLYLTYVTVACFQGLFEEVTLPPKILRFTMMPLLLFLVVVVFNLPICKNILQKLSLPDLVRIHIFRLIGSFFLILGFYKVLPSSIALIAGLGDVTTALSSIFVVKAIRAGKPYARKLTFAWNTFGFLDIVATSVTAFLLTKLSMETGAQGVDVLGVFPFCFIPAFAPATILFLHLSIYRKLWSANKR